jgi:hypothetical protein
VHFCCADKIPLPSAHDLTSNVHNLGSAYEPLFLWRRNGQNFLNYVTGSLSLMCLTKVRKYLLKNDTNSSRIVMKPKVQ